MPFEMDAEEVRRMSREERAKYNAEVEERYIRFSETAPVQSPFDEARLPGNEWALYPSNSMDVQQRLAAAGIGFTVLPSIAVADDIARGHLTGAPLLDAGSAPPCAGWPTC